MTSMPSDDLNAVIRTAANIARQGCLVPPDGGSPTKAEREMCDRIADQILALQTTSDGTASAATNNEHRFEANGENWIWQPGSQIVWDVYADKQIRLPPHIQTAYTVEIYVTGWTAGYQRGAQVGHALGVSDIQNKFCELMNIGSTAQFENLEKRVNTLDRLQDD